MACRYDRPQPLDLDLRFGERLLFAFSPGRKIADQPM
jgi:hypothetical protein